MTPFNTYAALFILLALVLVISLTAPRPYSMVACTLLCMIAGPSLITRGKWK